MMKQTVKTIKRKVIKEIEAIEGSLRLIPLITLIPSIASRFNLSFALMAFSGPYKGG